MSYCVYAVVSEEMPNNETDGEVSIGTEIPDLDQADEALTSYIHEKPSRNSAHFHQVQVHSNFVTSLQQGICYFFLSFFHS